MSTMSSAAAARWAAEVEQRYLAQSPASAALAARARASLPGGDTRYGVSYEPYPTFFTHGAGSYLWDADGRRILDLNCNATSLIHGHAHPDVSAAIAAQAARGTAWSRKEPARSFMGYRRGDGRVGTRNYIGILTSVNCSATVARHIAEAAERSGLLSGFAQRLNGERARLQSGRR